MARRKNNGYFTKSGGFARDALIDCTNCVSHPDANRHFSL